MALSDYNGEEIVANLIIKGGKKTEERVWMPRTVFNDPVGKDAFIIGNGRSRKDFDLNQLPPDVYGCNALYRDYKPNFLIVVDRFMYKEVTESGYDQNNIVYTNHNCMTKFGGKSHLIPSNPHRGAGATATHVAIHDGHTNLFMLGFDCGEDGANNNIYVNTVNYNNDATVVHVTVWDRQVSDVMDKHPDVTFTFVEGNQSSLITSKPNYKSINYKGLAKHIDGKKT
jgi:hypothetical protein